MMLLLILALLCLLLGFLTAAKWLAIVAAVLFVIFVLQGRRIE